MMIIDLSPPTPPVGAIIVESEYEILEDIYSEAKIVIYEIIKTEEGQIGFRIKIKIK
jgi:hypothetical protein